jgi:hypothetical protein
MKQSTIYKPEYAIPIKSTTAVHLRTNKTKDDHVRSFSFCKPMSDMINETRPTSMFNPFHYGLSNQFQANEASSNGKTLVKENIYASEIDVHLPLSDKNDYLDKPNVMNDYFISYKPNQKNPSILREMSRFFSRYVPHPQHDDKRKLKSKSTKHHHLRCSIM